MTLFAKVAATIGAVWLGAVIVVGALFVGARPTTTTTTGGGHCTKVDADGYCAVFKDAGAPRIVSHHRGAPDVAMWGWLAAVTLAAVVAIAIAAVWASNRRTTP